MGDILQRAGATYSPGEDQRWIGPSGIPGKDVAPGVTITLDRDKFEATFLAQGYIPSGVVLGLITATGLYAPYTDAATHGAGSDTAVGFLEVTVPLAVGSTGDIFAALYWTGHVNSAFLPTGHGLTAAARVDFAAKFRID